MFVVYSCGEEVLVTTMENEHLLLAEYFGEGGCRITKEDADNGVIVDARVDVYERTEINDTVVMISVDSLKVQ